MRAYEDTRQNADEATICRAIIEPNSLAVRKLRKKNSNATNNWYESGPYSQVVLRPGPSEGAVGVLLAAYEVYPT